MTVSERKSVLVRMSPELWHAIHRWAQEEFRSINGQIEFLLHKAVQERRRGDPGREPEAEDSDT